jgi:hypothetical protein
MAADEVDIDSFLEGIMNIESLQVSNLVDNMNLTTNSTVNDEFVEGLYSDTTSNLTSYVSEVYAENSAALTSYLADIESLDV